MWTDLQEDILSEFADHAGTAYLSVAQDLSEGYLVFTPELREFMKPEQIEAACDRSRRWNARNKEAKKAINFAYRNDNKEVYLARKRLLDARYRLKNRERLARVARERRAGG